MSEGRSEDRPGEGGAIPVEPEPVPPPAPDPEYPRRTSWGAALWPAVLLALVVAGVALSPFWAADVASLLPWGERPASAADDYAALAARVAAIEKRPAPPSVDLDAVKSAIGATGRRVDQLESTLNARLAEIEKRPASPNVDVEAIKSTETALAQRVDQLEAAGGANRQSEAAVGAVQAGVQQLEQRLGTLEAQSSSRAANEGAELQKVQQGLAQLGKLTADIENRVPALERQMQSQSGKERTDAALALLLVQMREAVEQSRPFSTEYNAFKSLDRDPEVAAAAEPLAEAARNGVASRAVLGKRLTDLAGEIATVPEAPTASDWGAEALARLRRLVTIRRIDGKSQTGPEAAVGNAQTALARGDLEGAVAALEALSGANADAARPWLRMARQRLAVEKALDHLQEMLAVRLGSTPAAAPAGAPAEPAAKARAPS
jgi:hypothetical protein